MQLEEQWLPVPIEGFEEFYEVSNFGNVRSLDRFDTIGRFYKGRLVKLKHDGQGYPVVCLARKPVKKYVHVHRLVALAFIPNPLNKATVNHIDEVKTNNRVDNLEWMTMKENAHHGTRMQRCYNRSAESRRLTGERISERLGHSVGVFDADGNLLKSWSTCRRASKELGLSVSSMHNRLCYGGVYSGGKNAPYPNCIWKYLE